MKTTDNIVPSSDGRHRLYVKTWEPDTAPKAIFQFVHGMYENTDRYDELFTMLAENGVLCRMDDHLGHGKTAELNQEYGFFGGQKGTDYLIADEENVLTSLTEQYPGVPVVLGGASMGSFIARLMAADSAVNKKLAGLVLIGTAGSNRIIDKALLKAEHSVMRNGAHYVDKELNHMAFDGYAGLYPNESDPFCWMTADDTIRDVYAKDHSFEFTASAVRDLFSLTAQVDEEKNLTRLPGQMPVWLLSGEDDVVGRRGKGVTELEARMKQAGAENVVLTLVPNARHDVLRDNGYEQTNKELLNTILAFAQKQ